MRGCLDSIMIRLTMLIIVGLLGGGAYFAVTTVQGMPLKQAQDAALARFGDTILTLCKDPTKKKSGTLAKDAKLAAINGTTGAIFDVYQNGLPSARRAKDKTDLTAVLCLKENQSVFDTVPYASSTSTTKYYCTQYQRDLAVFVVDVKSGTTVDYTTLPGLDPPECPDKTSSNISRTGDLPPVSDLNDWLSRRSK